MADWYRLGNGVLLPPGMPSPQGSLHTCSWVQLSPAEQGFIFSEECEVERNADHVMNLISRWIMRGNSPLNPIGLQAIKLSYLTKFEIILLKL
jgi:hypothetical protein